MAKFKLETSAGFLFPGVGHRSRRMFYSRSTDFQGAGKAGEGVQVWRIEKLKPVKIKPEEHGTFYTGDSYIVLKTSSKASSGKVHDIFFWLGLDSSQDEHGAAALKSVELDEYLGGGPTQHREVQGCESEEFLQCFPKLVLRKGGIASALKHVDREAYETRLLHVKGARNVRVTPVALSSHSLNAGDCFVLDSKDCIMLWNGSGCNKKERAKALDVSIAIKNELAKGQAKLEAFEEGDEPPEFWTLLGGKGPVAAALTDSAEAGQGARLFQVTEFGGTKEVPVDDKGLAKEQLLSTQVFILNTGTSIHVWVGTAVASTDRKNAMKCGIRYMLEEGLDAKTTLITVVKEGAETPIFKANFKWWHDPKSVAPMGQAPPGRKIASRPPTISSARLAQTMKVHAPEPTQATMITDPKVEVFDMVDFEPVPQPADMYGQLFAGDSYIIVCTYKSGEAEREQGIIYVWQGRHSSTDERVAAALHAVHMDAERFDGDATQVRVVMGKEPSHLINLFKGLMVVHSGGHASAFRNTLERDSYDTDGVALYQVKGSHDTDAHAVQVEEKARRLNSGDCFILLTPKGKYIWRGKSSNDIELATAKHVAGLLQPKRPAAIVFEGSETAEFWSVLGGKAAYPSAKEMPEANRDPRLFRVSNATGAIAVTPVHGFAQSDLEEEDVFILDVFTSLFIWVGDDANEEEKSRANEIASEYLKAEGCERTDVPIITVRSTHEPELFTCHFLGWDATKQYRFVDPYEAKLAAQADSKRQEENDENEEPTQATVEKRYKPPAELRLPYSELNSDSVPDGVDPAIKEQYLDDAEFQMIIGSSRSDFDKLKKWKKDQIKKAAGLF